MKNDPSYFNKKPFPKSRKSYLDDRGERHLVRDALLFPFKTFNKLGQSGIVGRIISRQTVAQVLKKYGIVRKVQGESQGLKKVTNVCVYMLQKLINAGI